MVIVTEVDMADQLDMVDHMVIPDMDMDMNYSEVVDMVDFTA